MKTSIGLFLFSIVFLFNCPYLSGQEIQWGIHLNAGKGWIPYMGSDRDIFFEEYNTESKFSFSYGGSIQVQLTNSIAFESGLMFLSINCKGHEAYDFINIDSNGNEEYGGNYEATDQFESSYLAIPLLFVLNKNRFNAKLGPQFNYLLTDRIERHVISNNINNGYSENIIYEYDLQSRKLDYGVLANLGYSFIKNFEINLQYYHGLQNIFNPSDPYPYSIARRNRLLTLGISYYFKNAKE